MITRCVHCGTTWDILSIQECPRCMPNERKIASITKGWGEGAEYYYVCVEDQGKTHRPLESVDKIIEEAKNIGSGNYNDLDLVVYKVYRNERIIAEIESNSSLTVRYEM